MESVERVLVLGSGAIKIAEAAEFDYSGSQALKALKEEGIETILINPNIATIQTSYKLADKVYLLPLKAKFVEEVIEKERPDGILLGFGGQSALSLGVTLYEQGVLSRYGVKVLGTPVEGIKKALDRSSFRRTMIENDLPVPPSIPASSVDEAVAAVEEIGFPVIVRISFNLGGRGSFIAWDMKNFKSSILRAFAHSEIRKVLIEKYLHHWKEIEFEVLRDAYGNKVAIACLENVDPMGIHTGDSVVVAPCQTLTNREYQFLRTASLNVAEAINLIGECNVQLALDYKSEKYYIIETNPRMSRSSALASKATGYPLAYIATKLALGYKLYELKNKITGVTSALFEPSLDYVVVKVPRWDLRKFDGVSRKLGSEMKSIGEVMAIGRNLHEAFQKAIRMLDIGEEGIIGSSYLSEDNLEEVLEKLENYEPYILINIAKALKLGLDPDRIHAITGVDKYFIYIIEDLVHIAEKLKHGQLDERTLQIAWRYGFNEKQIEMLTGKRFRRDKYYVKQIDTLSAEWPARTNYLYITGDGIEHDIEKNRGKKVLILGAGVFRIGVSVEFDWAVVNLSHYIREMGYEAIVLNYNPETVSTDWDVNDKLYFEEISKEIIKQIYTLEEPEGVITFAGGEISNRLSAEIEKGGMKILGTSSKSVDIAEDRAKFSQLLERLNIRQPPWINAENYKELLEFIDEYGFPVLIRPSYVLSGTFMRVINDEEELMNVLGGLDSRLIRYPIVVSKFIRAKEAEIDAVSDAKGSIGVLIEHVEEAGVHSGDATMVIPTRTLTERQKEEMKWIAETLARELSIRGPYNIQFLVNSKVYVIELNLRTSRSMPFSSKATGVNLMKLAAKTVLGKGLNVVGFEELRPNFYAVKVPQFSWAQLKGAYPYLSPEMRSTGEVASFGSDYYEALLKAWLSATPNRIPRKGVLIYGKEKELEIAYSALRNFINVYTLTEMPIGSNRIGKNEAISMLERGEIDLVITHGYMKAKDYDVRRKAVDMNVPLILNKRLGRDIAIAMDISKDFEIKEMKEYWR